MSKKHKTQLRPLNHLRIGQHFDPLGLFTGEIHQRIGESENGNVRDISTGTVRYMQWDRPVIPRPDLDTK